MTKTQRLENAPSGTNDSAICGSENAAFHNISDDADFTCCKGSPLETFTVSDKEAILSAFYENAPLLMGVVELCDNDNDVRFLLVNPAKARVIGCTPEAIQNKKASELNIPHEVVSEYLSACIKTKQTNKQVRFKYTRTRTGGTTRFIEVSVSPIKGTPNANRFLFVGEDTTIRHEALKKIRLLQSAVENAHDAILITEAPCSPSFNSGEAEKPPCILYVNPAFERLTGYSTGEAVGRTPQFLMPRPKNNGQNAASFGDALIQGKAVPTETLLRHKNGGEIWVEMSVCPAPLTRDTGGRQQWIGTLRDITARKQAEAEMRLKDRALSAAGSGVVIIDAQQAHKPIVYVNPAYEKMTGYSASEVLGKHPGQMLGTSLMNPGAGLALREAMENGRELSVTIQNRRKDGSSLWREIHISPVRDEQTEQVTHFIGVQNDVTEQKNAEVSLILRDRAIAAASNGIVICDARLPGMPIVYCNPAFETMTGYPESEVMGRNCRFLQGADTDRVALEEIQYALQNARNCVITLKNYRKNGDVFWNELSISPVRDAQNQLTHFVGVQNDVTERLAAQMSLLEAESRLRYVVRNLPLIVFAINTDGVFTFSDGKGLETLGLKPGEVVGRTYWDVYSGENELIDLISRSLQGEVTTYTSHVDGISFETTCNPQRGPNGKITSIIGFALDVTEQAKLEAQVLQSDKLAALGQLVAGVAHEINNPLAAISGHAQLLALHPDEEVQADARAIKTMTDRATAVVRSLLTFAHPSKGTSEERKPHTLRQLAEDTLHLTMFSLRKAEIDVHLYFSPDEPQVLVNASQIQQIILNLLTNAEHALRRAPEESDRHIIITTTEDAGFVSLTIADNGCGIPPAVQKRIFEPFFTTKDVGEGTGLGLSICHGIAVAHNGTLHVESSEGVGAAFILRLPAAGAATSAERK